jgi:3-hydroxyacyl-[acyl-carrier-protein] dehydratase
MIVEALAQVSGILGFKTLGQKPENGFLYLFAGIDDVRFKRQVVPGDRLELESEVVSERRGIWKFACKASVDGGLAASANVLCAVKQI